MRRFLIPIVVVVATTAGIAAASTITDGSSETSEAAAISPAPGSEPDVSATIPAPSGLGTVGVAGFSDTRGRRCATYGAVADGVVGGSSPDGFVPAPLADTGLCLDHGVIAFSRSPRSDDPATPADEGEVIVWGVANDRVENVRVGSAETAPAGDGTFIVGLDADAIGELVLEASLSDGSTETINMPALRQLPTLDELRRNAPTEGHHEPHP